jgi:hypothetical protein
MGGGGCNQGRVICSCARQGKIEDAPKGTSLPGVPVTQDVTPTGYCSPSFPPSPVVFGSIESKIALETGKGVIQCLPLHDPGL